MMASAGLGWDRNQDFRRNGPNDRSKCFRCSCLKGELRLESARCCSVAGRILLQQCEGLTVGCWTREMSSTLLTAQLNGTSQVP